MEKFYNNKLKIEYKKLFNKFDELIFLKTSSLNNVYKWRLKQEKNNKSKIKNSKKCQLMKLKFLFNIMKK